MNEKEMIEEMAKEKCEHFDEEVCYKLDCKKDCKYCGKANCYNCIHKIVCHIYETYNDCAEEVKEMGCFAYQPKIPEGSVLLSSEEYSNYLILQTNHEWLREKAKELQADNERLYKNLGKFKESVCKETAKEILERGKYNMPEWLKDWIVEQFGVEVEE